MLRNDLIRMLGEQGYNAVTVYINGSLVNVDPVTMQDGSIEPFPVTAGDAG